MKTFVMTLAAAGAAAAAPAMAQYGYHDDSAHHRYAPATYSSGTGTTYSYAARPYAVGIFGTGAYAIGGHYDYHPSRVHGSGYGVSRPASAYTPSHGTGYGSHGGHRPAYPTATPAYRPSFSWSHSDSAHHGYGW